MVPSVRRFLSGFLFVVVPCLLSLLWMVFLSFSLTSRAVSLRLRAPVGGRAVGQIQSSRTLACVLFAVDGEEWE